jgi:hypothetical protein
MNIILSNTDKRSQTTPRPEKQKWKVTRILPDESRNIKEWLIIHIIIHYY